MFRRFFLLLIGLLIGALFALFLASPVFAALPPHTSEISDNDHTSHEQIRASAGYYIEWGGAVYQYHRNGPPTPDLPVMEGASLWYEIAGGNVYCRLCVVHPSPDSDGDGVPDDIDIMPNDSNYGSLFGLGWYYENEQGQVTETVWQPIHSDTHKHLNPGDPGYFEFHEGEHAEGDMQCLMIGYQGVAAHTASLILGEDETLSLAVSDEFKVDNGSGQLSNPDFYYDYADNNWYWTADAGESVPGYDDFAQQGVATKYHSGVQVATQGDITAWESDNMTQGQISTIITNKGFGGVIAGQQQAHLDSQGISQQLAQIANNTASGSSGGGNVTIDSNDIKQGVSDALSEDVGGLDGLVTQPNYDGTIDNNTVPGESDTGGLIDSFLANSPASQAISGSGLELSNSLCSLSCEIYGKIHTIDFCSTMIVDFLNLLGSIIIGLSYLTALFIIFH